MSSQLLTPKMSSLIAAAVLLSAAGSPPAFGAEKDPNSGARALVNVIRNDGRILDGFVSIDAYRDEGKKPCNTVSPATQKALQYGLTRDPKSGAAPIF